MSQVHRLFDEHHTFPRRQCLSREKQDIMLPNVRKNKVETPTYGPYILRDEQKNKDVLISIPVPP